MNCMHGINLKHKSCAQCEAIATSENNRRTKEAERAVFDIDLNNLHEELARQSPEFHGWAVKLADAMRDVDEAKTELDVRKAELKEAAAELAVAVRANPGKYGLEKVTVDAVNDAVLLQPRYKVCQERVFEQQRAITKLEHLAETIRAAKDAYNYHRKMALEKLVELRLADYFSEPRLKGSAGQAADRAKTDRAFNRRGK